MELEELFVLCEPNTLCRKYPKAVTIQYLPRGLSRLLTGLPYANNQSSEVIDIVLPATFYFYTSTTLDMKNL